MLDLLLPQVCLCQFSGLAQIEIQPEKLETSQFRERAEKMVSHSSLSASLALPEDQADVSGQATCLDLLKRLHFYISQRSGLLIAAWLAP